ncbi:MAG: TonB-dependent receptor [Prolixibacteraceae bacterium]|jgi:TonB-linked SusC/RagA family outer membrane protein|nr:TonB-dependent receptor [Prolixibacteraceae bacterium]
MKKKRWNPICDSGWKKIFLIMRVTVIFLLAGFLHVSASVYSQQTNLHLKAENASISQVLKMIEEQSDFHFLYRSDYFNEVPEVTIEMESVKLEEVLNKIIVPYGFAYVIDDKTVVIRKSDEPRTTGIPAAQKKSISGKVTDSSGASLPGVSVVVKGTTIGIVTDVEGKFSISVPVDANTLVFTFVGMKSQEVSISGKTSVNIKMEVQTEGVEEVVVVGYGTQKKLAVTGAISAIGGAELAKSPATNIANSLAGRVTGLASVQYSGQPGVDDPNFYVRGIATLAGGSSAPLIIVDGVERSFSRLDPNEIESISILKDASSTAVYGVRGANGVIYVTTRRGVEGKPVISISTSAGAQQPTRLPKMANAVTWTTLYNESQLNDNPNATPMFSAAEIELYRNHKSPILYPDTDWYKYMLRPFSFESAHNINISGGDAKVKYFISVGYRDQSGLFTKTRLNFDDQFWYDQYNLRANLDINLTKSTTLGITTGQITGITREPYRSVGRAQVWGRMYAGTPISSPGIIDGKSIMNRYNLPIGGNAGLDFNGSQGVIRTGTNDVNFNVELKQKLDVLTKGLGFKIKGAYNSSFVQTETRTTPTKAFWPYQIKEIDPKAANGDSVVWQVANWNGNMATSETYGRAIYWYMETGFNYERTFGVHNVTGLLLYNESKRFFPGTNSDIPTSYVGLVGRGTYNYGLKYFLDLNVGYNGSENFAVGRRFGLFPAVSAAWQMTREKFMRNLPFVNYLKLRGSFGIVGNDQIGGRRFLYLPDTYSISSGGYNFGTTVPQNQIGAAESTLGNPFVTWEKSRKGNIGLDLKFLKERLSVTLDRFYESRDNILITRSSTPSLFSVTLPPVNLGKVDNKGYEVEVAWSDNKKDFGYYVNINMSFVKNKIVFMDEIKQPYDYLKRTGQQVNQVFGYVFDGLWSIDEVANQSKFPKDNYTPHPGDMRYKDLNSDGIINSLDQKPIGYPENPQYTAGLKCGINYKNFDFSMLWNGATNTSRLIGDRFGLAFGLYGEESLAQWIVDSRWTPATAATATYPRLSQIAGVSGGYNTRNSDFFLRDASYARLKNIEFGYTIKNLNRLGIATLRVYVNGYDLLTIDKLKILDPESNTTHNPLHPLMKTYNVGLSVTFK